MRKYPRSISKTLCSVSLAGTLAIATGIAESVQARSNAIEPGQTFGDDAAIALDFKPPGDTAPYDSTGGGTRGGVTFKPPADAAPSDSTGGGTRGGVTFKPPADAAPSDSTGGGTRGGVTFKPPGETAPTESTGGGTRGGVGFEPPGDAAPENTTGGGTRGDEPTELMALIPQTKVGRTVAGRPTFFVYVPPQSVKKVFFSVQDEQRNHHYQTVLEVSDLGGVVSVTLPEDAPELEIGKNYLWFFAPIAPGEILRPDNYGVTGWVKRVQSSPQMSQMSSLTPLERATLYADSGIWYDTLTQLVSGMLVQPTNATLVTEWKDLLEQVGLEAIATVPVTDQL